MYIAYETNRERSIGDELPSIGTNVLTVHMLQAMELSADMGNAKALGRMLRRWGPAIGNVTDQETLEALRRLTEKFAALREVESIHGSGAALNLQHTTVQDWIAFGILDEARVSAARACSS